MFTSRARIVQRRAEIVLAVWVVSLLPVVGSSRALAAEPVPSQGPGKSSSSIDKVPAYHYRQIRYKSPGAPGLDFRDYDGPPQITGIEEGWAVRGVGRRVEVRQERELVSLMVETPRWRFRWDVTRNVVFAYPSCLNEPEFVKDSPIKERERIKRWSEHARATYVSEKDRLNGEEVDKITFTYLADPGTRDRWPIHGWKAEYEELLQSPDVVFRTRTYWFDPKTRLLVQRQCGCKPPKHDDWVDYPAPESIPRDLFRFEVPRDATLRINDSALGRLIVSEVEAGPDLRD